MWRTPLPLVQESAICLKHKVFLEEIAVMSILISLLITFLVIVLVLYLIARLPIDGRAKQIAQVIVIIIGIISLLRYLAVF
jgi:hypothetical protein